MAERPNFKSLGQDINNRLVSLETKDILAEVVASTPNWYRRYSLPTVSKTSVTIPAGLQVEIDGSGFISKAENTLLLSTVATAANRAGKDVYIYAVVSDGALSFVLSLNSTVPTGYTASSSRKIGGFHCLCSSVGTISGHKLTGYSTGDILPGSIWDLLHRPVSDPEGMVYIEGLGLWVDIYLATYTGSKFSSAYQATIADGASSVAFNGERFAEYAGKCGKRLVSRDEFIVLAKGSNEETNISGSADPGTAGGHVDTAGRRMISDYGIEDCCGSLWQWTSTLFESYDGAGTVSWRNNSGTTTYTEGDMRYYLDGYSWKKESVYNSSVDDQSYGSCLGLLRRVPVGGHWANGSCCGSRSAVCNAFASYAWSTNGARFVSEPRVVNS